MSWADYFRKGFGGNKNGSTYLGLDATTDEEFGLFTPKYFAPQPATWTQTTTYTKRPHYHAARSGKRWK